MTPKQKDMRLQAESHYEAQEWADAERLFHALSKQMEPDGNFLHDRAVCLFQLGRKTEALNLLDRAVDLEPETGYRYASRAWMRAAMKDVDGAIEDYRKAIEIDPEHAITLNNLGLLEEQYGMRKAAQERFRRADTLSGILREAGVNPPGTDEDPGPQENEKSNVWTEIKTVFTDAERRREFLNFIKNGMRL